MNMQLLIDSGEFWWALKKDIRASRDYIYIQILSFERDLAGKLLSDELLSSSAKDKRILVDSYTKYVMNDRFLYSPRNWLDADLQMEKAQTWKMFEELNSADVKVKLANPVGFMFRKFPARDHKKIVLIDNHITYVGGINFSDHNFEWHDLMVRIDDTDVATFLKSDFLSSWQGIHQYAEKNFNGLHFYLYDGQSNESTFQNLFGMIDQSQSSIFIESPYISFPFYKRLRAARERGVNIMLITPARNNWGVMAKYTLWEARRSGIDLWLYQPRMTHAKAMLIDDRALILGSTNFDYISYKAEQELAVVITDETIINDFRTRLVEVDLQNSRRFVGKVSHKKGFIRYLGLKGFLAASVSLAKL